MRLSQKVAEQKSMTSFFVAGLLAVAAPVFAQNEAKGNKAPARHAQAGTLATGSAQEKAGGFNPGPVERLDRLEQMTPEERAKVLDRLPAERRVQLQAKLQNFDRLSPDGRQFHRHPT